MDKSISVIIPTKDAGGSFRLLLSSLASQEGLDELEIIVVDSGSQDETLATAAHFNSRIRIYPHEIFSHGDSRNFGAELASHNYLFFTVQDALIPDPYWLSAYLDTIENLDVVAASCVEYPHEHADLLFRGMMASHYEFIGLSADRVMSLPAKNDYISLRQNAQLTNVSLLIRRDIFRQYRFRKPYAEDVDLGLRLIQDGHRTAYLSSLGILHAHDREPDYYLRRGYIDNLMMGDIFSDRRRIQVGKLEIALADIYAVADLLTQLAHSLSTDGPLTARQLRRRFTRRFILGVLLSGRAQTRTSFLNRWLPAIPTNQADKTPGWRRWLRLLRWGLGSRRIRDLQNGFAVEYIFFVRAVLFNYLERVYPSLDDAPHDAFWDACWRALGFTAGEHLSHFYSDQGSSKSPLMAEIDRNLRQGV